MRKKALLLFLVLLCFVTIFFVYDIYQFNKQQQQAANNYELFTTFPSPQLQTNLRQHKIPFIINEENQLFIAKKYTQQAIICCS